MSRSHSSVFDRLKNAHASNKGLRLDNAAVWALYEYILLLEKTVDHIRERPWKRSIRVLSQRVQEACAGRLSLCEDVGALSLSDGSEGALSLNHRSPFARAGVAPQYKGRARKG